MKRRHRTERKKNTGCCAKRAAPFVIGYDSERNTLLIPLFIEGQGGIVWGEIIYPQEVRCKHC